MSAALLDPYAASSAALETAESDLGAAYGIDSSELRRVRDEAIERLRTTLQATPTPKP